MEVESILNPFRKTIRHNRKYFLEQDHGHAEHTPPATFEIPDSETAKTPELGIGDLPEVLGYQETEEIAQLRGQLVEAMLHGADTKDLANQYQLLAEVVVNQRRGNDFIRAQIGLTVQMALIRHDGGRIEACVEDLENALEYAENLGLHDVVALLDRVIGQL